MAPDPPFEARTRADVRWRDLDMLGHLNQSVYHELLEEGRAALFVQLEAREWFVLGRVELDYKAEVRHDHGPVEIVARVDRVGRSSVTVTHEVVRNDGVVAAAGSSVLVGWDRKARRSQPFSDEARSRLLAAAAPA